MALSYPVLSDHVLRLRPWSFDDLECVQEASTDPAIPSNTTVPARWTVDAGRAFIDRQRKRIESAEGINSRSDALVYSRLAASVG